jgi:hypothetical protein
MHFAKEAFVRRIKDFNLLLYLAETSFDASNDLNSLVRFVLCVVRV